MIEVQMVIEAAMAERACRKSMAKTFYGTPEYNEAFKAWKASEDYERLARKKLNEALKEICPVAVVDPTWIPSGTGR